MKMNGQDLKKKTDGQFSKIAGDLDPSLQAAAVCLYLFD
jgi:hypothetical protein